MSGQYSQHLAQIHSNAYTGGARGAFPWPLDTIRAVPAPAALHDIGCGDGAFLTAAKDSGLKATGSDISAAFVRLARARSHAVHQAPARYGLWPAGISVLTALGEVLSYLDGDTPSLWDTAALAAKTLPRGGLLIGDLTGPSVSGGLHENSGEVWRILSTSTIDDGVLVRRIDIEGRARPQRVEHRQPVLPPDAVHDRLTGLGFDVTLLLSYGTAAVLPGRFVVLARKT